MPFSNMDHKKVYYYVICVMAFFVLMWGAVDLASSSISWLNLRSAKQAVMSMPQEEGMPPEATDQLLDGYYQKNMVVDRFWDSLVRVLIAGGIFTYCRMTVERLENKA